MAHTDMQEPEAHPAVLLLPWYEIGTLSEHERRQVEEHLATCASCRAELAELQAMRVDVRDAIASEAKPSPAAYSAVQARTAKPRVPKKEATSAGFFDGIANTLQSMFSPRWVSAAAVVLIVAQAGTLVWMSQRPSDGGEVIVRGLSDKLKVSFEPTASEEAIRELLLEVHARIISGPTRNGTYIVELFANDRESVEERLVKLRSRSGIVRSAEQAEP